MFLPNLYMPKDDPNTIDWLTDLLIEKSSKFHKIIIKFGTYIVGAH